MPILSASLSSSVSWRAFLIATSVFVSCLPAFAGSYVQISSTVSAPNPSGGTWSRSPVPSGQAASGSFYPNQGNSYGANVYGISDVNNSSTSASVTGTITTKFQWVPSYPGDPIPKNVIVTEYCSVLANGTSTANERYGSPIEPTVANVDNGLNDPSVTDPNSGASGRTWMIQKTSSGQHSRVVQGADPLEITCTVSASASASAPLYGSAMSSASVAYSIPSITPVEVALSGYTLVGSDAKVLIGQGLHASLTGCTLVSGTKPTWSFVTGGDICFGNFLTGAVGQEVPVDMTQATLNFFTKKLGSVKVGATANAVLPDGTVASVQAESRSVASLVPSSVWTVDSGASGFNYDAGSMYYNALWQPVTITVPAPFSGGKGCFAQIITPSRTNTRVLSGTNSSAATTYVLTQANATNTGYVGLNGVTGIDGGYPYPYGYYIDSSGNYTPVSGGFTWNVGQNIAGGDKPTQPLAPSDVDMGGSDWRSASASDSFNTWLMYQPVDAGGGISWVPLRKKSWSWNGTASRTNSTVPWTVSGSGNPGGSADANGEFPTWTFTISTSIQMRPAP